MNIIQRVPDRLVRIIKKSLEIRPIAECQSALAFDDSQKFIYEKSGLSTMTFSDQWGLRIYRLNEMLGDGEVLEFGVFKAKSINFMAKETLIKSQNQR